MLEIAIIEDEEKEAAHLGAFLDRFAQETGVELRHSWYSRAADFLEHYQRAYDVVFMDIRMPDMDGMEAAQEEQYPLALLFSLQPGLYRADGGQIPIALVVVVEQVVGAHPEQCADLQQVAAVGEDALVLPPGHRLTAHREPFRQLLLGESPLLAEPQQFFSKFHDQNLLCFDAPILPPTALFCQHFYVTIAQPGATWPPSNRTACKIA